MVRLLLLAGGLLMHRGGALDNGLALTPPMGWNTWLVHHWLKSTIFTLSLMT
jgi:hypothetical protein